MSDSDGRGRRYSFDTETHIVQPGLAAPPLVVAAVATPESGSERLHLAKDARVLFKAILQSGATLENTYIVYDLGVMATDDPSCLPLIFKALDEGRIFDTVTLEALHDNARGLMFHEANGAPFGRYSQLLLERRYLDIDRTEQKKGEDAWRLRYHELDGVPLEQWPVEAMEYPRADARYAIDISTIQRFGRADLPPRMNLQCFADEMRFAFAAQLMHIWGIRTDPLLVDKVIDRIERTHNESRSKFLECGIVRIRPCAKGEEADAIDLNALSVFEDLLQSQSSELFTPEWVTRRGEDLIVARKALKKGRGLRYAVDTTRLKELVTEAYQGEPPLTETGKVSASRDTLVESDNELLEAYGEAGENEKLFSTYRAVLQQGTKVPINAEVNAIVETQRTSMRKPNLQQLPQKGLIRECFIARGYDVDARGVLVRGEDPHVFLTSDWVAFEMSTLAQSCINLGLESEMAKAINRDEDLHIKLAARVAQMDYAQALALKNSDDPAMLNLRKAMKPCLEADTLVLTERGWIEIVNVTQEDRLWDGDQWVTHDGLAYRGNKETLRFQGVAATPDHVIPLGNSRVAWSEALTSPSLFQRALSLATLPSCHGSAECATVSQSGFTPGMSFGVPDTNSPPGATQSVSAAPYAPLAERSSMPPSCPTPLHGKGCLTDSPQQSRGATALAPGSSRPTAAEASPSHPSGAPIESLSFATALYCRGLTILRARWTESTTIEGTSPATSDSARPQKTLTTDPPSKASAQRSCGLRPVYDIVNAGPQHRFTVMTLAGPLLVHNCNFGLGGLMGPPKLVFTARKQDVRFCELAGISANCASNPRVVTWYRRSIPPTCSECLQLAAHYKQLWYEVFPEMVDYHRITVAAADQGSIDSFGTGMVRACDNPNACSNHLFQNLAAQIAKKAVYQLARESYTDRRSVLFNNYRGEVLVHDEAFAEVREPFLHDCMKRQVEIMLNVSREYLTDVKVGIEPASCRRWFKGAKPVYTKDGLLKPWWPSLEKWTFEPDRELQAEDLAA